jgi:hypothetical protein
VAEAIRNGWTRQTTETLSSFLDSARLDQAAPSFDASRLAHEWLLASPPQIVELRAGRHVGQGLVQKVEGRVAQLRRLDDFVGGRDLVRLVERELVTTVRCIQEAIYDTAVAKRLLGTAGELCQLAGWVAADAGLYGPASKFLAAGVKAAHAAGDVALAANLISTLSYQTANVGNPAEAALLAQTACVGAANSATATTKALLADRLERQRALFGLKAHRSARYVPRPSCCAGCDDGLDPAGEPRPPAWPPRPAYTQAPTVTVRSSP